jgi:CheY-like chemotaxis protein
MVGNEPVKPLVLVVENDATTRALICLRLSRIGCQVTSAEDGIDALEKLRAQPPRVLILDTYLPRLGGLDVLKTARTEGLLQSTKVIILSSLAFQEVVQQAAQAGAHAFMMKPVDVDLLDERITPFLKTP